MFGIVLSLVLLVGGSLAQQRVNVDGCTLEDLTDGQIETALLGESRVSSGESNVDVSILARDVNCLSVGRIRNRFRYATLTVRFLGRAREPTVEQVAQVDFVCVTVGGRPNWEIYSGNDDSFAYITDQATIANLTNSDIVTDCAACLASASQGPEDDAFLHCDRCASECLVEEQRLCYGETNELCCNVYINNVCMNECPLNFAAGPSSNFECVCALQCQNNGTVNDDCTGCNCAPQFTGPLCEDPCNPNQCVNGTCSPGTFFPDFSCTCDPGFTGELCEIPINPCVGVNCSGNGDCRPVNFMEFVCECDAGFTGQNCEIEICTLPNCKTCMGGVCVECLGGFDLTSNGLCAVNCSMCENRETQCSQNICNFYCLLNDWAEDVNSQGFSISSFSEPDSGLPKSELFSQINTDANSVEGTWTDRANGVSSLASLQPPARTDITFSEWVRASTVWINNIIQWRSYVVSEIDSTFPEFDFQSVIDQLESEPQAAFESITDMWRQITVEYRARVLSVAP